MAKAQEITALVRAHIDGDHEHFRKIVLSIAANAEGASPKFAKSLRDITTRQPRPQQFMALKPQMESLLAVSHPVIDLENMVLDVDTRARIDRFLLEQTSREKLVEHGLSPSRKLLFVGPSGVGKSMMSSAIAHALSLPMLRIQLHGVVASHLGETAANLGRIFQNIREMRGVYLFDEFDALAAERGGANEVGEMRRTVNSLLLFIENDDSDSIIVAATNHQDMIDRAMFRRFDQVIEFMMPTPEVAESLVRSRLLWTTDIDWNAVRLASQGIGHADLTSACHHVNKDAVMADRERITTNEIVAAIEARRVRVGDASPSSASQVAS